jgi:hypothetical protein
MQKLGILSEDGVQVAIALQASRSNGAALARLPMPGIGLPQAPTRVMSQVHHGAHMGAHAHPANMGAHAHPAHVGPHAGMMHATQLGQAPPTLAHAHAMQGAPPSLQCIRTEEEN